MNICFFSTQYLPTVGGVERYTFNIAKLLVNRGHNVTVVTSSLPGFSDKEKDSFGTDVIRLPSYPIMKGRFPFVKVIKAIPQLKKLLSGMDFAVVQTRFYPLSVLASVMCKKAKVPFILIDHSTGHMPMGSGIVGKAAGVYEHIACAVIRKSGGEFYGVSRAVSRWLKHFNVASRGQLYNAVDLRSIEEELNTDVTDFRKKLNLDKDEKIISFAGRLIPEKGVEILIDAFSECKLENVSLLIAGDGMLYEKLSAQNNKNVYLLGSLSHNHTLQLMSQSDVYCLPTLYAEGFPTTFLEAAACHCPVITTKTGGSSEFIPDPSFGTELEKPDADSLCRALKKSLSDEKWRRTAKEKSYENLKNNFIWTITRDRLEKIAEDKINGQRK